MEGVEFVTCRICGTRKSELNGHLKVHGLKSADYKERFPGALTISEIASRRKGMGIRKTRAELGPIEVSNETRQKISNAGKRRHERERQKNPEAWLTDMQERACRARAAKGDDYKHSDATKAKMRGPREHMRGIPMTEETKAKLSVARKGKTFSPHSNETIRKMRDTWTKRKENTETYEKYRLVLSERSSREDQIIKLRNSVAKSIKTGQHNGKSKDTSLEKRFMRFADTEELAYEHQFILETRKGAFTFDFYLPAFNLLVEVDGEWWHRKTMEVLNRDTIKGLLADEMGYRVLRISDRDWRPGLVYANEAAWVTHNEALLESRKADIACRMKTA